MLPLRLAALAFGLIAVPVIAPLPAARADGTVVVRVSGHPGAGRLSASGVRSTLTTIAGTGGRLVRVDGDPVTVAARLRRVPGVAWAEPNRVVRALETAGTDDPYWPALYGVRRIGAAAFWATHGLDTPPLAEGVPIAVVDTGVDAGHEDLAGRVAGCAAAVDGRVTEGECADGDGHGTHVAGTIGALRGNGLGVVGVAPASPLWACRALGAQGSGTVADVAACIAWAHARGAKVISMSLGGPTSRTLAEAAKAAYARGGRGGSLLVAAAGNDGDATLEYPAALSQVVSVAAIGPDDQVAPFSNANADVELAAPGVDILSTRAAGGYVRMSGTSMATPHVAAAAALLWGADRSAAATTIRRRLDAAVDDAGAAGRDAAYGFGIVNLANVR
jgi:thermitase